MNRLLLVGALLACSACGTETDDRPPTLDYITEAILAPSCAQAECHAGFSNTFNYSFDTVKNARRSLVQGNFAIDTDGNADNAPLAQIITIGFQIEADDFSRMPYDEPLPDYDTYLIKAWIATQGNGTAGPLGAQCIPSEADPTKGCDGQGNIVACGEDGNLSGSASTPCAVGQQCLEAQCVAE